jgi:hypothetical protein
MASKSGINSSIKKQLQQASSVSSLRKSKTENDDKVKQTVEKETVGRPLLSALHGASASLTYLDG